MNTCALNTNETALIPINAALNLLTKHRSLGREATRLRNMSICSDLASLVSYLFICFSSLVVLARLMLYFQPERKFPGRVEPHIVSPRVSPFSKKCWNIVETCTTTDCYAQCLEFVRALPDFQSFTNKYLQTFTTTNCEPTLFNKFVEPSPENVQQHIVNPNVPPFSRKCVGSCTTTYWANSENFYGHSWRTVGKMWGSGVPELFGAMISLHLS